MLSCLYLYILYVDCTSHLLGLANLIIFQGPAQAVSVPENVLESPDGAKDPFRVFSQGPVPIYS